MQLTETAARPAPGAGYAGPERRRHPRVRLVARADCRHFNARIAHTAVTVDLGAAGLALRSPVPFRPGTPLTVRLTWTAGAWRHPTPSGFRHLGVAEVRWCRPVGKDGETGYILGLQYYPHP